VGCAAASLICAAPIHVESREPVIEKKQRCRKCRMLAKKDGRFKLDADTVLWIRREAETQSQASLARKYSVNRSTVWDILHRRKWKHL
jgi:hypothetical protein